MVTITAVKQFYDSGIDSKRKTQSQNPYFIQTADWHTFLEDLEDQVDHPQDDHQGYGRSAHEGSEMSYTIMNKLRFSIYTSMNTFI
jgi:hypothetical protein